ncbi:hypothetical protein NONO_c47190 [Nocardia nova SH22a]|uniref:Uncharacterized protein n=1 Tax=Nocardia nova SH22a TaxID=1415166 RepID=W5TKM1_9NOCA|nr:hypothetical protein NONO_c47190 [Nocardia nova SH22a]
MHPWPGTRRPGAGRSAASRTGSAALAHAEGRSRRAAATGPHGNAVPIRPRTRKPLGQSESGASRGPDRTRLGGLRSANEPRAVGRILSAGRYRPAPASPARSPFPARSASSPLGSTSQRRASDAFRDKASHRSTGRARARGAGRAGLRRRPMGRRIGASAACRRLSARAGAGADRRAATGDCGVRRHRPGGAHRTELSAGHDGRPSGPAARGDLDAAGSGAAACRCDHRRPAPPAGGRRIRAGRRTGGGLAHLGRRPAPGAVPGGSSTASDW